MVLPRMFIESRATGSWARAVIFTLRRAVFICGDTLVMVPCTTVPFLSSIVTVSLVHFMRNLGWGGGLNCQYGFWPELCHRNHGGGGLDSGFHHRVCGDERKVVRGTRLGGKEHLPDELHLAGLCRLVCPSKSNSDSSLGCVCIWRCRKTIVVATKLLQSGPERCLVAKSCGPCAEARD